MHTNPLQIAQAREGDVESEQLLTDFDLIYQKHAAFVWRTLRSLGVPREEVEDAAQEVFCTVYRKLRTFEARSSFKTWLCGISVGVARNHTRKRARHSRLSASLAPATTTTPGEATEALDLVSRCLSDLDEGLRMVFVLSELEQMSAPEISEVMTTNLNTVYSRLRLARKKFDESLSRHGGSQP